MSKKIDNLEKALTNYEKFKKTVGKMYFNDSWNLETLLRKIRPYVKISHTGRVYFLHLKFTDQGFIFMPYYVDEILTIRVTAITNYPFLESATLHPKDNKDFLHQILYKHEFFKKPNNEHFKQPN